MPPEGAAIPLPASRFLIRRRLILGAAAGTVSGFAPLARAATGWGEGPALRVGLLLPPARRLAGIPGAIAAGFESYLARVGGSFAGRRVELVRLVPPAGPGASIALARKAVGAREVDLLCGMADRNAVARLAPLLREQGVAFLVTDLGADVVRARNESPFLVRNPLGLWQAAYAMGEWATANLGDRALLAVDFLESGHDMVYAFRHAFERGGGSLAGLEVTGLPNGDGGFAKVAAAVRRLRPSFVQAFYSGSRADAFLRFYAAEGLQRIAPLAGAGLLTDFAGAGALPASLAGVVTASPRMHDLPSGPGLASPFDALGYEAAQRIDVAARRADRGEGFALALAQAQFDGPRGPVDPLHGMSEPSIPVSLRRLAAGRSGLANEPIARLPPIRLPAATREELRGMVKTGWAQAYLAR